MRQQSVHHVLLATSIAPIQHSGIIAAVLARHGNTYPVRFASPKPSLGAKRATAIGAASQPIVAR